MFVEYADILSRIDQPPVWWHDGVPRYDVFKPWDVDVYADEVVLVHVECQFCRVRYDVAAIPRRHSIRLLIERDGIVGIGNPPNALHDNPHCPGRSMLTEEIAVLQFWERLPGYRNWQRNPPYEQQLADANNGHPASDAKPILQRFMEAGRESAWAEAYGDYERMALVLREAGFHNPEELANMIDVDRRTEVFYRELREITDGRKPIA